MRATSAIIPEQAGHLPFTKSVLTVTSERLSAQLLPAVNNSPSGLV